MTNIDIFVLCKDVVESFCYENRTCNSVGAYFRSSRGIRSYLGALLFWNLCMLLAASSLFIGVLRGLGLPMNGSSYDSFGSLKCALKWSLWML